MELFDDTIPYLRDDTTPQPVLDILQPVARLSANRNLGLEAARWFMDTTKTDLAEAIKRIDSPVEPSDAAEADDSGEDVSEHGRAISAALSRLALMFELSEVRAKAFEQSVQSALNDNLAAALDGSYIPSSEIPLIPQEHERVAGLLADELEASEEQRAALADILNPKGSSLVSAKQDSTLEALAAYVTKKFGTIGDPRLEISQEQRRFMRQLTGKWYPSTDGQPLVRSGRSLVSIVGLRTGEDADAVITDINNALLYLMATPELPAIVPEPKPARVRPTIPQRVSKPPFVRTPRPSVPRKTKEVKAPYKAPFIEAPEPSVIDPEEIEERLAATHLSDDTVRDYLRKISRHSLLNAAEEVELAKAIEVGLFAEERFENERQSLALGEKRELQALMKAGQHAKETLTNSNLRLVISLAKRYRASGMQFQDLVQEGNLGLDRAVKMFDYTKGFKFSTYATWWIRQAITRGIGDQARTIRLPVHMYEQVVKLNRITSDMTNDLGRQPTDRELALELEISNEKLIDLRRIGREPISLNMKISDESETEFGEMIDDPDAEPVDSQVTEQHLAHDVGRFIDSVLDERQALVIRRRFGIGGNGPTTLEDIGKELGVTRERARQIESKAMSRLRLYAGDNLAEYLSA